MDMSVKRRFCREFRRMGSDQRKEILLLLERFKEIHLRLEQGRQVTE